jgi:hypothetical protein
MQSAPIRLIISQYDEMNLERWVELILIWYCLDPHQLVLPGQGRTDKTVIFIDHDGVQALRSEREEIDVGDGWVHFSSVGDAVAFKNIHTWYSEVRSEKVWTDQGG